MTRRDIRRLAGILTLIVVPQLAAASDEKVVYHINDSANARPLLNNVRNHLDASPEAKIEVVAHGKGIDFMLDDATDANGNPYGINIEQLGGRGVVFKACRNTLASRKLGDEAVAEGVVVVPSGVAEIAKLQAREGYVYLKP